MTTAIDPDTIDHLDFTPAEPCMAKDCPLDAEWRVAYVRPDGQLAGATVETCTPHKRALEVHVRHCPVCRELTVVAEPIR